MSDLVIYSNYKRPPVTFEHNSGESEVDISLYVPTKKRVEQVIRAGENLLDHRQLQYHSDQLEHLVNDENWTDPLIYRGLEKMDIEKMHREAIDEILQRRAEQTGTVKDIASEAKQKDQTEPVNDAKQEEIKNSGEAAVSPAGGADQ